MTSCNGDHDGQWVPPDLAGRVAGEGELAAEVTPEAFLDPAFITALANEFYAEGRPPAASIEAAGTAAGVATAAPLPDGLRFGGLNPGDDFLAELRASLTAPTPEVSGAYYFLRPPQPAPPPTSPLHPFPVERIREDFPILREKVHGKPLVWMDNAATTQKPRQVIEALTRFYERHNSNTRAHHTLAERVTGLYAEARAKVSRFLGAAAPEEIVFTRGATESINLVAQAYGRNHVHKGDEIVLSTLEHHANIIPWQQLTQEKGAVLRVIPVNDRGEILLEEYEKLLGPRTRVVAITHVSNALGTVLPVRTMTQLAHRHGARVLIDGAQSVPHMRVDVQALGCDFFLFAGHKMYGPTGVGVLYAKRELLEAMPPWQTGGNVIDQVSFEHTTYKPAPAKFEAGTASLASAIGLGVAVDYLEQLGMDSVNRHERELLSHAIEALGAIPSLRFIGMPAERAGVLSFVLEGVDTEEVGRILDHEGIAVRVGRHCAQPTMRRFGLEGTVRPSFALYNTHAEIDALAAAVRKAKAGR